MVVVALFLLYYGNNMVTITREAGDVVVMRAVVEVKVLMPI